MARDFRPPLFSVRGITKRFPDGFTAIYPLDMDIREGECLVVAGSNGSGKTLLMRMIAGLLVPSGGTILFRGTPLAQCGALLRRSVGIVFQDPDAQIVGQTVEEDIRFGPENLRLPEAEIAARVRSAAALFHLEDKLDAAPRRLSGGEKRRLAVAGVLAMGCGAVIMDEPFANLDWPGVVQTLTVIRDLKATGATLIVLTHELEKVLAFADRLLILDQGVIRACGAPDEVLDKLDPRWGVRDPRGQCRCAADCTWL